MRNHIDDSLYLFAIHTNKSLRHSRLSTRATRPLNKQDADSRDLTELRNLDKATPIALADFHITNNASLESLFLQVRESLEEVLAESTELNHFTNEQ